MDFEYNIELAIQPVPDRDDHDFSIYLSSKRGEKLSDLEESSQKSPPSKQGKWNYDSRENTANPHHIIQHSPMKAPVILKLLSALGEYIPNIGKLMKQSTTRIDYRQFENLALNSERILTMLGVKLTVPKGLLKVLTPKLVVVGTLEDDDDRAQVRVKGYLEIAALLQFKAMVAIGDKRITIDEFEKLLDTGHELVEFRDSFVAMNAREVQNLLKEAHSVQESVEERISPIELLKQQFGGLNRRGLNMFLGASEQELVDRMLRVTEVSVPQGLRATLRPYQERGLSWLASNADKVGGCVLADDMGLGKTVQIIAMLQHLKCTYELCHERPALIVAPSSLLTNWSRELAKFAPCLNVLLHHGDARDIFFRKTLKAHEYSKQNPDSEADCQSISEAGVHTRRPTYDSKVNILSNSAFVSTSDATEPARKKQRRSITRDTLKAIAEEVTKKKAADVILTSYGTLKVDAKMFAKLNMSLMVIDEAQTIKNHKSQISKLCKQVSKTAARRVAMTGTPVENRLSELHSIFDFALPAYLGTLKSFVEDYSKPIEIERNEEVLENLKRLTDPFLLRRLKTDPEICKELPPKVEQVQYASLSPKQGALYQAVTDDILAKIEEAKENGLPAPGLVFKLLIALKQICNHPDNYTSEESVKQETTESKILQDINTSGTPEVADSGKMQLLLELLRPILARGEKVLIFTQYVKMAYLLKNMIARTLYTRPLVYSGALSVDKRQQVLDKFDIDPANSILILSLKAGGVGLNLTQANHVIHYDRWFNPAVEAQASDRAFRIGQTKRVFVHHFVCQNTFEDKIHEMIQRKKELANLTVTAGEKWIGNLRHDELQDLFSLAPGKRVNDERGDDGQD
ncbi:hypothetical protein SARC_02550 [Sphaeroforma arctica JP610]|uniref:Uncharacterized protein n=1 Tax=Sphaeroforma arctica JP610 TaxID=667725 RepID=A0A0L0G8L6_9EUKA|nr:hypothetical protein SARC_02550 [Sphaeroforma arctica JP610]KNC85254.1 hypothetical protein SARC_02550 [Sphaeroforma arctica JP610]|eukprot:XP_014159156.1 hypothetical protein SARC_02550 [Sphaeroforma arctica JP610]